MANRTITFFKSISTQSFFTIILGSLEILVFSIMSRLLSKTDFGYYAALTGITVIFTSISDAGIGSALIQKLKPTKEFVSSAFTLCCTVSFISSTLFFILSPYMANLIADEKMITPLRLMTISLLVCSINSYGISAMYRNLQFKRVGILKTISYSLSAIVGIFMAYNGYGVYSLITLLILNSSLLTVLIYITSVRIPKLALNNRDAKDILSFGGWLTLGVISSNIAGQLDKLLLPRWLSIQALGAYNRPAGFVASITNRINRIYDTVLFPMLSDVQDNKRRIVDVFLHAISLLNSFAIIMTCVFFFNSNLIIRVFFGEQWMDLTIILKIISLSIIFLMNSTLVDCFIRAINYVKVGFIIRFMGIILSLVLIYIGSKFDIVGVALAILISNIIISSVKIIVLTVKLQATFVKVLSAWMSSWMTALPLCIIAIVFIIWGKDSFFFNLLQLVVFFIILLVEFIFFPKLVSREYEQTIYPKIVQLVHKTK